MSQNFIFIAMVIVTISMVITSQQLQVSASNVDRCSDRRNACNTPVSNLPVCAQGQQPTRNRTTCCLSCRYAQPTQNTTCSRSRQEDASRSVRQCGNGEMAVFYPSNCSLSCRQRVPDNSNDRPSPSTGRCTRDAFEACENSVSVCAIGEDPIRNASLCCPSCVAPEQKCNKTSAAECMANRPECATDEEPVPVEGDCCKSCRLPVPTCSPACSSNQICMRIKNDSVSWTQNPTVCRNKATVRISIGLRNGVSNAVRGGFRNLTCQGMADLISTVATSYCSQNANEDRCNQVANTLRNMRLSNKGCTGIGGDSSDVNIEIPNVNQNNDNVQSLFNFGFQQSEKFAVLASSDAFDSFVSTSFSDTVSNTDFTAETYSDDSSAATHGMAVTTVLGVVILGVLSVLLM